MIVSLPLISKQLNQWNNNTGFTTHAGNAICAGASQVRDWDEQYHIHQHAADTAYTGNSL